MQAASKNAFFLVVRVCIFITYEIIYNSLAHALTHCVEEGAKHVQNYKYYKIIADISHSSELCLHNLIYVLWQRAPSAQHRDS